MKQYTNAFKNGSVSSFSNTIMLRSVIYSELNCYASSFKIRLEF